ncbi:uncharacterized protein N0V89_012099 [Didymosphaeria variabile]|uniref:Uncharacterized protein n=1 Tax=Didymosphaeria variabile TaxID=1932322 RepID=A0A9W8X8H3_9PLEO|nr:uncharacterized protein N0V89_012099 [Didymosphaeria variabile]KAJ4344359.1 hypothetical protein N0V89_012099 [Didymosphaeria variabile]
MSRYDFLFRKGGIPALASCVSNTTQASCAGSLIVRVNECSKQATIELEFGLPVHGFETDQRITFVYDGNNFASGAIPVKGIHVSPENVEQITQISRSPTEHKPRSMQLTLTEPCVVLSPSGSISPKQGHELRFQQVATLARATKLDIVFDFLWLHRDKDAQFRYLIANASLTGFAHKNADTVEHDWTIFGVDEAVLPEVPPPYDFTSQKRSRHSSPGSPQTSPKRPLLDFPPGSPTEKATTAAASLSPRFPPSSPSAPAFDAFQSAIENAVENAVAKIVPDAIQRMLPDALAKMIPNAIEQMLPDALENTLTRMVNKSVAAASAAPGRTTQGLSDPTSPLYAMIRQHLDARLDELANDITIETQEHAQDLRDTAKVELEERLDDHRLEITELQAEGIADFQLACATELEAFKEQTLEMKEDFEQGTAEAYTTAKERLDELVSDRRVDLKERLMVEAGRRLYTEKPAVESEPTRRASSVPLGVGW